MPPTPNIVFFGESGSGKSSIINMIAERPITTVSSSVRGCTFQSTRYPVNILGSPFNVYDTAGLDEGDTGIVPKQAAIVQLFRLLKSLESGVNLLVFCMRGPRIKEAAHQNWRFFHEIICRRQVPIVMAITGLEEETVMDDWWDRNRGAFQEYEMYAQGVACITATRGKLLKSGRHRLDEEYEESKEKMWKLLKAQHRATPWKVQPIEWFSTVINVTYESHWWVKKGRARWGDLCPPTEHRHVERVVGPGIQELVKRCEMTSEEAKALGEMLAKE